MSLLTKDNCLRHGALALLMTLTALFAFTGCEVDNDWWATDNLVGTWRVVEVGSYDEPPYQYGDRFTFYSAGDFNVTGSGGLYETGTWRVDSRRVMLNFNQSRHPEMVAYITQMDDGYMSLEVTDYSYNITYRLRLVRQYY